MRLPITPSTGRDDRRVGEVQLRLALDGFGAGEGGLRLSELRREHVELLVALARAAMSRATAARAAATREAACWAFCTLP